MSCCVVPNCPSAVASTPQVKFPKETCLRNRWEQLIQQGACSVTLPTNDQGQEIICIKHFVNPEDYAYQEPVLFTDSTGQPIKLATCRLCQKVQRESDMSQLEQQIEGQSLAAVIFSTLRIRMRPSEYSERVCQQCVVKIDQIRALQTQYSILESEYQDMAKARVPLEVVEPAVMKKDDQNVDDVPEDLVEYLEEAWHEEFLDPKLEVQIVWEPIESEKRLEPQKKVMPPKIKESTAVPEPDSNGWPKRKKYEHTEQYLAKLRAKPPKPPIPPRDTGSRTCNMCKKLFPRRDDLLDHLLESHATPEGYKCAECDGKPFETVIVYNTHLKFHDATARRYKCSVCALRFCNRNTQHQHENLVHGMTHPIKITKKAKQRQYYQCDQCGKMLPCQATMERHKQIHEGTVQCDICDKTVPSASHLIIHKLRHVNEKPFQCTVCDKRYASKHFLKLHTAKIHEQKQAYQCRICNGAFNSRTEYRKHAREAHAIEYDIHGERLRFKCALCPEVPTRLSDLTAHVEACHAGEEYPYKKCELCPDKKFIAATALNTHRQWKHRSYVRPDRKKAAERRRKREEEAAAVQGLSETLE